MSLEIEIILGVLTFLTTALASFSAWLTYRNLRINNEIKIHEMITKHMKFLFLIIPTKLIQEKQFARIF